MRQFVCDVGGYEVLLHGSVHDGRKQILANVGDHPPITVHDDSLQRAVNILTDRWATGVLWWAPMTFGREAILKWFRDHDVKGRLKPERERELAEAMLAAVKEL